MDYSIKIGGEAGQGIQTVGDTLAKVFARSGYNVFSHQDYESRVRGGHNFYQVRFSDSVITASRDSIDILIAFDQESITRYEKELSENGHVVYDSASLKTKFEGPHFLDVPFSDLAVEHGGSKIMANTVSIGAVMGMLGMELDILNGLVRETFSAKGEEVVAANLNALKSGHLFSIEHCARCSFIVTNSSGPKLLISGTEAIALGALASGCQFYCAYPMTPSTGIMNYIAGKEKEYGVIVEQAEDEISAINMALGASFGGARSMTGTSGGGFALMVEGLSLAGITETPVVIALGQRPGPATGLPTRTEQGDLQFALYTAHGEFPRILFAPGTPEQAFHLTNKAFDLAEKYQVPAIVLFDQYIADTCWTYDGLDTAKLVYQDYRVRGDELKGFAAYKRYAYTDNGVSPLGIPGDSKHLIVADSDEHDEDGHIIEDAATRNAMIDKRLFKKLPLIRKEVSPPLYHGGPDAENIIIGWGSTYGIMREAVAALSAQFSIGMLHFSELSPFPSVEAFDYLGLLRKAKKTICIENNATGQFARLLRAETGFDCSTLISRFDGRPFTLENLTGEIRAKI